MKCLTRFVCDRHADAFYDISTISGIDVAIAHCMKVSKNPKKWIGYEDMYKGYFIALKKLKYMLPEIEKLQLLL